MLNNAFLLGSVMLIAGIGIPTMAALNSGLGARLGNPNFAAMVLFALGLIVTGGIALAGAIPGKQALVSVPPHLYLGGLFVAFYVLAVTWIAPRLGVGNVIFLVLLGQLIAAAAIDHFGWLGAPQTPVSLTRVCGLGLIALGVFLARRPTA